MKNLLINVFLLIIILSTSIFGQKFNDQNILPIELLYFEGFSLSNGILLRWGTATEVNNFGFEVQRADTSKFFEYVDFVPGSGNSNSPKHYFLVDSTLPGMGLYFYRLKQIDTDGSYHFSDTIQVYYNPLSVENVNSNSPGIFFVKNDYASKDLEIEIDDKILHSSIEIEIYSILGQRIYKSTFEPFTNKIKISYSNFSSGVYILAIKSPQKDFLISKFIVAH
ncbi:MAG: T9SS type A sorting domain-containing protein [Ignavibacteria bacterium]